MNKSPYDSLSMTDKIRIYGDLAVSREEFLEYLGLPLIEEKPLKNIGPLEVIEINHIFNPWTNSGTSTKYEKFFLNRLELGDVGRYAIDIIRDWILLQALQNLDEIEDKSVRTFLTICYYCVLEKLDNEAFLKFWNREERGIEVRPTLISDLEWIFKYLKESTLKSKADLSDSKKWYLEEFLSPIENNIYNSNDIKFILFDVPLWKFLLKNKARSQNLEHLTFESLLTIFNLN